MFTHTNQQKIRQLPQSAVAFQSYLTHHQLSLLDVALASSVRYLTVWRIAHALPVEGRHAALVRAGLQRLTGVPYTAGIPLLVSSPQHRHQTKEK